MPISTKEVPESKETAPSNVEAEAAFLGAVLIDNRIVGEIAVPIRPEHFFAPAHIRIFDRILHLLDRKAVVTPVTLKPYFEADEALKELGGASYLARLTADGQGLLAPRELAEQIVELSARRDRMAWLAGEIQSCADTSQALGNFAPPPHLAAIGNASIPTLDLDELARCEPLAKSFIIPRIAPAGEVTLFTGPGAVGKSLLAQQLCTAVAIGVRTLGLELARAPAIYLTCEDDAQQLHWRQAHICAALGVGLTQLAGCLHLASLRGEPDNALAHFAPDGRIATAPLFGKLVALIRSTGAKLVCLDNVAHLFCGNENDRAQVTSFINLLNRTAGEADAAILLMAHPNKAGDSYSGSTGWLNAVRSQVFMSRSDEEGADPDLRSLTIGKPNYTRAGEVLRFRWHEWAFILDNELPDSTRAELDEAIRASGDNLIFLACLAERTRQQRAVSEKRSATFAPTVFGSMPESKGIGSKRLEAAMDRLFRTGRIERERLWNGPDRKPVFGLREIAGNGAGDGAGDTMRATRETLL